MAKSLDTVDCRNTVTKSFPEKPTFTQTCNLLSKFMKEKRLAMDSTKGPKAKLDDHKGDASNKAIAAVMKSLPQFLHNSESDSRGKDQMTIFYDGKVLVFNDFAAENATEIMEMATKLCSRNSAIEKAHQTVINSTGQNCPPTETQTNDGSNLKIARRASLHKFFEKRKERVTSRGPYPLNNPMAASTSKPTDESSSGASEDHRDFGQCSKDQLDLSL